MDNEQAKTEEAKEAEWKIHIKDGFKIVWNYLLAVVMSVVLFIIAFFTFADNQTFMMIYSGCCSLMAFGFVYSTASKTANHDAKPFYDVKCYASKGFVIGLVQLAVTAILLICWQLVYVPSFYEQALYGGAVNIIFNAAHFAFVLFVFPFNGFLMLDGNSMSILGYVLVFLVPYLACGLGYLAGFKNFSIYDKYIYCLVYKVAPKKKKK